jgi:hypothetical protein
MRLIQLFPAIRLRTLLNLGMSMHQLTPAQLQLQAERKAAKQAKAALIADGKVPAVIRSKEEVEKRRVLSREWIDVDTPGGSNQRNQATRRSRVVSWNVSWGNNLEFKVGF